MKRASFFCNKGIFLNLPFLDTTTKQTQYFFMAFSRAFKRYKNIKVYGFVSFFSGLSYGRKIIPFLLDISIKSGKVYHLSELFPTEKKLS